MKKVFLNEIMIEQYRVENDFIDLVFPVHKLAIEIDENGHLDRFKIKEQNREQTKKEAGFEIIRIYPDKEDFDVFDEIGEIQSFIVESTKNN